MNKTWTHEQSALARQLMAINASDDAFRVQVGRSKRAARAHIRWVDDAKFRADSKERKQIAARAVPKVMTTVASRPQPLPEQIEAAIHRLNAPRSITAMMFGDPAPGQSALDRRAQVSA
ncbi:MAG: hypothetical protein V4477_16980 [Pseudomonadota bacterium]